MMSTLEKMMLLLPIVFMFHDFEEIIMFRWWLRKNRSQLQQRFPSVEKFLAKRKMFSYSTAAFSVAVMHEFLLISLVSYAGIFSASPKWWFASFMAFFIHLIVHIMQWIAYRTYIPMIITSILALPYCFYTLSLFIKDNLLSTEAMFMWTGIGVILMLLSFPLAFFWASKFHQYIERKK